MSLHHILCIYIQPEDRTKEGNQKTNTMGVDKVFIQRVPSCDPLMDAGDLW